MLFATSNPGSLLPFSVKMLCRAEARRLASHLRGKKGGHVQGELFNALPVFLLGRASVRSAAALESRGSVSFGRIPMVPRHFGVAEAWSGLGRLSL